MANRSELLNDSEQAMRLMLDGRLSTSWTAIPAIVTSVNLAKMTLEAQPAIQGVVTDENGAEQLVNLPVLVDVPITYPSAGGFTITFPITPGDEVLIIFSSRCIDAWWQSGEVSRPMEARMHDLSDGFAIPGPKSQPKVISGISSANLQIRKNDGTSYIEITPAGKINLVAPAGVEITGNLKVSGTVIGGPLNTSLTTHVHSGVTTGGGSTTGPV